MACSTARAGHNLGGRVRRRLLNVAVVVGKMLEGDFVGSAGSRL
jgi:hypothetical protein